MVVSGWKKSQKRSSTPTNQLVKNTCHRDRIIKILGQSSNPINAALGQRLGREQVDGGRRTASEACVDTIPFLPTFGRML